MVWPADRAGCGHYRLIYPARALQAQGADIVIDTVGPTVLWDRSWEGLPTPPADVRLVGLAEPPAADVVVVQRPGLRWFADLIPHLQDHGIRVVVDVDDRFDRIPKANGAHDGYRQPHLNPEWVDLACRLADTVTATTPALAARYGHGHGLVVPNLIPASHLDLWPVKQAGTVGWSGVVASHPGDLEVTGGAVQAAVDRYRPAGRFETGWSVHIVGAGTGVRRALRLTAEPTATGLLGFDLYLDAVAELEVGIVPLADTEFNRAKSCLKGLEMAAAEVPAVMSPTPDNLRLHRAGTGVGLIADSRGQWVRHLSRLFGSAGLRADVAGRARETVAGLTYEKHAGRWWDAWACVERKVTAA